MKSKIIISLMLFFLVLFFPSMASIVNIIPSDLNATQTTLINITVNNTEILNISRVSVLLPYVFTNIANIGTSANISLVNNPSPSNLLIWTNKTPEGFVKSNKVEYFWFSSKVPSLQSSTNLTIYVNLTYLNSTEELFEINVTIYDVDMPIFYNLSYSKANNTKYSQGANYGFQITFEDNVNISTVIFSSNFNSSINLTVPLFAGSNNRGIYVVNFTDLPAGIYWFLWYANDTSGNWNATPNITYVIQPSDNPISVYINGVEVRDTQTIESRTTLNLTAVAKGILYLFVNGTPQLYNENRLEVIVSLNDSDVGFYEAKINVSSTNSNYTSNSTGVTFFVKIIYPRLRFKDLQVPSSTTYSPEASYTFRITFYSLAYPLNNISNVSFIFNNQVYYLTVNRRDNETYSFTVRDLAAGSYSWKFCANDTQNEMNCTSGSFSVSQAVPQLNIINVQDYVAPVNKTILAIGCPSQLVCKLYLNDTELPNRYYELVTDKAGYYIFTYNTSGNANYSAASITKALTVYPPKEVETITTTITTNFSRNVSQTQASQQSNLPFSKNIIDLKANTPIIMKTENPDLLKVTEIEITSIDDIKNVEVKVEIASPIEIQKEFLEKNKILLIYFKIVSNVSSDKIANVKIRFRVEKVWISANNIDDRKVYLYKFENNSWVAKPTKKISEDENVVYYETDLTSLSLFSIVGEVRSGFPWLFVFILIIVLAIIAILIYLFLPTPLMNEYEKLKRRWGGS
jgi:PGF-pre-PGF domain-containing protein